MSLQPLVGRTREMNALRAAASRAREGRPGLALLYGPRRVGKTFLARHLLDGIRDDARTLYFAATQQAESVELSRFGEAYARAFGPDALALSGGTLRSWEHALRAVVAAAGSEPVVVVIDEYTYLEDSTPGFSSIVQAIWDELVTRVEAPSVLLVLTGSAIGAVEASISTRGALYGRATSTIRLDPFDLPGATAFLTGVDPRTQVAAYAACGGYPLHLRAWNAELSVDANLRSLLSPGGVLLGAARSVLEGVPAPDGHRRVLTAIGRGRERYGDIASEAGQRIEGPLDALVAAAVVTRRTPVGAPRRAAPRYVIADTFLRFWFTVGYADQQLLEAGETEAVMARAAGRWRSHLGWVYEDAARAHARRLVAGTGLLVGGWWTASGEPVEIDVLGLDGARTALIGEVKWTERPDWRRLAATLRRKLDHAPSPGARVRQLLWTGTTPAGARLPDDVTAFGPADVVAHAVVSPVGGDPPVEP